MKRIHIKAIIASSLSVLLLGGCSKVLEEQPRSVFEPGFFKSEKGVQGGITSLYAHLRGIYGQAYYYNSCITGTDEATYGRLGDGNFKDIDLSGAGTLDASSSRSDVLWNNAFSAINTASGIIENAALVNISTALIAEARFFRAYDYFMLVQTFGGVPLDLGAGELKFNTNAVRFSTRSTVPEVYTKAVFPDLLTAVNDLPVAARVKGGATKTLARLMLAKAYLTYAWWLQNPNNIPTYPQTARTDPDGHNAQWYFQQAYDVATTAISNPGAFGLQATYYDVNVGSNDRNNECLLYADHTQTSEFYNASSLTYANGGGSDNFAGWMLTWNYPDIRSSTVNTKWDAVSSVQREASQWGGRPWVRMAPPIDVFTKTFADKTNDSRYDGTFATVYRGNWPKGANPPSSAPGTFYNAFYIPVKPGDAILTFLNDEPATPIDYSNSVYNSNVGAGVLAGRADFVISPEGYNRSIYPGLWKLGPYRTDNGTGLGQPNAAATRPFNIVKFSELYFIAAEAAVKGATTTAGKSARDLINVIRARAGKWKWSNAENAAKVQDNSAVLTAATPATVTIDFLLAERSREYYGEGYRWFDLVRTQKWTELASSYRIGGSGNAPADHKPVTVTRNIQPFHYLRPVPRGQLDFMNMTAEEKATYQNPGYN